MLSKPQGQMGLLGQPRHCSSKGIPASEFKMGHMGHRDTNSIFYRKLFEPVIKILGIKVVLQDLV
jgi:hypothetical protein